MANADKHKQQASHNEKFYCLIKDHPFYDWAATGLFYAAIHYIEGYLSTKKITVGNHRDRLSCISKISDLKPIYNQYRRLYDTSVNARYKFLKINKKQAEDLYKKEFQPIKMHISPLY